MAAICSILAILATGAREELLRSGALLLAAALFHNIAGYVLGYFAPGCAGWERRTAKPWFSKSACKRRYGRWLAAIVLKSPAAALAADIFGTLVKVTGPALASWWRDRPP